MDWYRRENKIVCDTTVDRAFLARDLEALNADESGERELEDGIIPLFSARSLCCLVVPFASTECARWRSYRELLEMTHHQYRYYKKLYIPKRGGGSRAVYSPDYQLRKYQKWLLNNVLHRVKSDPHATAYIKGRGVRENAIMHSHREMLVKLDIKSFFNNVTFNMVLGVLRRDFELPNASAVAVARLCTLDGHLPQGACTSPMLANLCMRPFDEELAAWCGRKHITYTRYSDDMTFSGQRFEAKELIHLVRSLLKKYGFVLNDEKTRVLVGACRKQVTGVVVNDGLSVPKEYKRAIRQELYYISKYGLNEHLKQCDGGRYIKNGHPQRLKYLSGLLGRIKYVQYIEPDNPAMLCYAQTVMAMIKIERAVRRGYRKLRLNSFCSYDRVVEDLIGVNAEKLGRARKVLIELSFNNSAHRPWLYGLLTELHGYIRAGVRPTLKIEDCSVLPADHVIIMLRAWDFDRW